MSREPNAKPRTAGDILREMAERAKAKRRPDPLPPEDAPPPPQSHHEQPEGDDR